MLQAKGLVAGYRETPVLRGVDVELHPGQAVAVLGPNGAGKSTLFKALIGLLDLDQGEIVLDEERITHVAAHTRVRHGLAYLPQVERVFPSLSLMENLRMGAYTMTGDIRARIEQVLSLFPDLAENVKKRGGTLSGGQQTMLGMARALMVDPKYLLLDEPTAGLSPLYMNRVWERIQAVRDTGIGVLVIEQNVALALQHADYAYVLVDGQNAAYDRADQLIHRSDIEGLFVG